MASPIQNYIIGVIIFGVIITAGVFIITSFRNSDPTYGDSNDFIQFNSSFNTLDRAINSSKGLENTITKSDSILGDLGPVGALFLTGFNALKGIFTSFAFMTDVILHLFDWFGIPKWILVAVISIISITIVFSIYNAMFNKEL